MRWFRIVVPCLLCLAVVPKIKTAANSQATSLKAAAGTFVNPLLRTGPDPWVVFRDGYYFYMNTTGRNLTIWKTKNVADLQTAEKKVIWTPPPSGPYSKEIWAPELHFLDGKWYVYFAADDGKNESHRLWVLEGCPSDPLGCTWELKGKLADQTNKWAIDPSVFQNGGRLFLVWSGWEGDENGMQNIYIAPMKNPWMLDGKRVRISSPELPWEKVGGSSPPNVVVNEGPEVLQRNGKVFLTYSASGCWTDSYALGMLTADGRSDLLKRSSWIKSPSPVFSESVEAHAYGPGHNGFFQSADGGLDWIIYHANPEPGQGCKDQRSPRAQPFTWKADGSPDFGKPVGIGIPLARP
jgi:GH43 family beta-xylosidase